MIILDTALHFFTISVDFVNRDNLVSYKIIDKYSPSFLLGSYRMFMDMAKLTYVHLYLSLMLHALLYYVTN